MCAPGMGGVNFCNNIPGNAGTVCRASADACDVAETCTGTSRDCPADQLASTTTVCRASAGSCDAVVNRTGRSPTCAADHFQSAATVFLAAASRGLLAGNCTRLAS